MKVHKYGSDDTARGWWVFDVILRLFLFTTPFVGHAFSLIPSHSLYVIELMYALLLPPLFSRVTPTYTDASYVVCSFAAVYLY